MCATYALTQALLAANLHPKQDPVRANALNLGGIPVNAPALPYFQNRRILSLSVEVCYTLISYLDVRFFVIIYA